MKREDVRLLQASERPCDGFGVSKSGAAEDVDLGNVVVVAMLDRRMEHVGKSENFRPLLRRSQDLPIFGW